MFPHLDYSTIVQSNISSELDTVGGGDPDLASYLRIEEREFEAGGLYYMRAADCDHER